MPRYTMCIEPLPADPDRYLPPSWPLEAGDDAAAWREALRIAAEQVGVKRVLDDRGREVFD